MADGLIKAAQEVTIAIAMLGNPQNDMYYGKDVSVNYATPVSLTEFCGDMQEARISTPSGLCELNLRVMPRNPILAKVEENRNDASDFSALRSGEFRIKSYRAQINFAGDVSRFNLGVMGEIQRDQNGYLVSFASGEYKLN